MGTSAGKANTKRSSTVWAKSSRFWRGFACTRATFFDGLGNTSRSRAKGGPQNFTQTDKTT
ncbi:hypothetical protein DSO57_1002621 [Entomophthora muscae]|uniref:Uncharacterized protein n=1 Tax=Entomophthora muscae TaxID=34485 RepID=A0ACC2SXM2_9FUNG|nr:hypothetical protein DSO57_1002621 [Entomophthora muscae]